MLPGSALLATSEDLHAWSIYRQNLNSDFTDSALGSQDRNPLPYGNFQLRESTVQSILRNPREGSSGYDSSDDGGAGGGGRRRKKGSSGMAWAGKSKSNPDLLAAPRDLVSPISHEKRMKVTYNF
ncbi:hypothetical protein Avbf_04017, partial [Armadillidium vulgare]